ncbi:MAG: nuclear transport factor 2 family protein [Burkholderiales bacterium]|nr:nuclear transport factor 2 family protein [Burkholderiales bacterium]
MRALAFALALATGAAVAHPPGAANDDPALRAEILAVREEIQKAVAAKDVRRLQQLYAETFTHTHGSGRIDGREQRIVSLLAGEPVIELAPVSEVAVRGHGGHTAILQARSPILNVKEQKYYDFRWMWVLVKEGGVWRVAASQATRLPDPPRDKP